MFFTVFFLKIINCLRVNILVVDGILIVPEKVISVPEPQHLNIPQKSYRRIVGDLILDRREFFSIWGGAGV